MTDKMDGNLLDYRRIEEISGGDREFETGLLKLFVQECEKGLVSMRTSIEEKNRKEGCRQTHSLRGACANVGANPLVEGLTRLEKSFEQGDFEKAAEQLDAVQECFQKTADYLSRRDT